MIIFLQVKGIIQLIESYETTNDDTQEDSFLYLVIPLDVSRNEYLIEQKSVAFDVRGFIFDNLDSVGSFEIARSVGAVALHVVHQAGDRIVRIQNNISLAKVG